MSFLFLGYRRPLADATLLFSGHVLALRHAADTHVTRFLEFRLANKVMQLLVGAIIDTNRLRVTVSILLLRHSNDMALLKLLRQNHRLVTRV